MPIIKYYPAFFKHNDSGEIIRVDAMGNGGEGVHAFAYDSEKTLLAIPLDLFDLNFVPVGEPESGETWVHDKTHKKYRVIGCGVIEKTIQRCVVYRSIVAPDLIWVRPLDEFLWRFTKVEAEKLNNEFDSSDEGC